MTRVLLLMILMLPLARTQAAEVQVFAAASLTDALQEIARQYQARSSDRILFNLGASSTLARQIQEGARADLFLSADEAKVDALERRGLISARRAPLSNTLVVVVPRESRVVIRNPRELVRLRRVALAEPSAVPAGIYAREYLTRRGLWTALARKIVPTDNVRSALAAVESGNVDAAIVYRTDALISRAVRVAYEVPRMEGPRIAYVFALTTEGREPAAARRFYDYLCSTPALETFARHGFLLR